MYAWEAIEQSLTFIEKHLTEEIYTEELANIAGLSPFYFQRLFKQLVNKPVQEYVKLRRLAKVIENLGNTEQRILDVALDYGFTSHANFTRAFKETYGITPEEYRRDLPMLNTFDKPEVSMKYVLVDEGVPLVAGNIVLEIQRKVLAEPEVYLGLETEVRISGQIPVGESTGVDVPGQLWKRYHRMKTSMSANINTNIEMGMSHTQDAAQGLFTYFAGGLAQNIPYHQQEDFVKRELPAGEYIVCRIEAENFEDLVTDALNQSGKYLFGTWLPNHNLTTEPFSAEKYYRELKGMACMEIWVKPLPLENKR
ncbi:AraC family transcriptional regulator [Enterocloster aldenensis]|uniref:AraC family transcriptional regulator n=1 Tax=Enterocloster aldenensis TaxID=358742 RepID=UPI000E50A189|nr:AraC family transcriptional regulator [Enterocloster aldenensis]